MSKPRKINRRRHSKKYPFAGRPNRPWRKVLVVIGLVALVFLGISVYGPIYNYFSGNIKPSPVSSAPPESSVPPPVSTPESDIEIPEVKPVKEDIHGVLLPYETAVSPQELDSFLDSLPENINTVVIEAKNPLGQLLYSSENLTAKAWGAVVDNPINLVELSSKLDAKNKSLAVVMSVFSDPIAARGDLGNAIMHSSGVIWIDNTLDKGGKPWANPYSQGARKYNQDLAVELSGKGAKLVVFDYLRFPNDPTKSAVFGETKDLSRGEILGSFLAEAHKLLGDTSVAVLLSEDVLVDIDGSGNQVQYGGNPLNISTDDIVLRKPQVHLGESTPQELSQRKVILMGSSKLSDSTNLNGNYIVTDTN